MNYQHNSDNNDDNASNFTCVAQAYENTNVTSDQASCVTVDVQVSDYQDKDSHVNKDDHMFASHCPSLIEREIMRENELLDSPYPSFVERENLRENQMATKDNTSSSSFQILSFKCSNFPNSSSLSSFTLCASFFSRTLTSLVEFMLAVMRFLMVIWYSLSLRFFSISFASSLFSRS